MYSEEPSLRFQRKTLSQSLVGFGNSVLLAFGRNEHGKEEGTKPIGLRFSPSHQIFSENIRALYGLERFKQVSGKCQWVEWNVELLAEGYSCGDVSGRVRMQKEH